MASWAAPDIFTTQLDIAASISEQLAEASEDKETRSSLANNASTLRRGSKVARTFKASIVREFEGGVRPTVQQAAELATR